MHIWFVKCCSNSRQELLQTARDTFLYLSLPLECFLIGKTIQERQERSQQQGKKTNNEKQTLVVFRSVLCIN